MRTRVFPLPSLLSRHFGAGLFCVVVLLNLVVMAFAVSSVLNSRQHYQTQASIQIQNLAHAIDQNISHAVDKFHQSIRAVVYELEQQLASGGINEARIRHNLEHQKRLLPEAIGFHVIDDKGGLLIESNPSEDLLANVGDRDYFLALKAHADAGLVVSKPVISRFSHTWVIPFALRFNHPDNSFAGAVVIPVSVSYFSNILSGYEIGQSGVIVLRDRDAGLVARHAQGKVNTEVVIGAKTISEEFKQAIGSGSKRGEFRTISPLDGVERAFSFRYIERARMYVITGLSKDYYLTRWHRDILETVAFAMGFMIVTGILSVLLFRFWKQQERDTSSLQESHERLNGLLVDLQEREYALAVAQEEGHLGTFFMDMKSGIWHSSDELDALLGIDRAYRHDVNGWSDLVHPDDRAAMRSYLIDEVFAKKQVFAREYRIVRPRDGEMRWVYGFAKLELDEAGESLWFRGSIRDITESKRLEEHLRLAREAFIHVHESIVITDKEANIIDVNPAFTEMTGYSREEALGKNPRILQSGRQDAGFYQSMWDVLLKEDYWEGEFHNKRKDGRYYSQSTRISTVRDGDRGVLRYIGVASDVTQIRASQLQIEYLAMHDKLTDLPNRVQLAERLKQAIKRAEKSNSLLAVCYLDLDGFKAINDLWGHDVGDLVLIEAARRLQGSIRATDTVARLGGDEFVVLIEQAATTEEIADSLRQILGIMSSPFEVNRIKTELTASVGVAIYPDDVDDADMLIRRADQAMYIAKRLGRNQFHLFDSETDRRLKQTHELGLRINTALKMGEFRLYYQPKVEMMTGKIVGAEALIRWHHPNSGVLPPLEFLPVVENTELSIRLGEWVIRQALAQMDAWLTQGISLPVSVNISGYHLQRPDFVSRLSTLLDEYPSINPNWLELEILETVAMEDVDHVSQIIHDCAKLGVYFSLDDFGTGYSSLTYFRRLPTQLLKIDHSFVRDMLIDVDDYALVESIVKLAHSFNRRVIAEGVETIEHGIPLMQFGCNLAQGFGIARPMPAEEIPDWISNWTIPEPWKQFADYMRTQKGMMQADDGTALPQSRI